MSLGAGLQVIRGFFMSVRAATARILVNVQVKNMAFYDEGPLDQIMNAFMSANGPNRVNLLRFVKKLSVDVTHTVRTNSRGQRIPRIKNNPRFRNERRWPQSGTSPESAAVWRWRKRSTILPG